MNQTTPREWNPPHEWNIEHRNGKPRDIDLAAEVTGFSAVTPRAVAISHINDGGHITIEVKEAIPLRSVKAELSDRLLKKVDSRSQLDSVASLTRGNDEKTGVSSTSPPRRRGSRLVNVTFSAAC